MATAYVRLSTVIGTLVSWLVGRTHFLGVSGRWNAGRIEKARTKVGICRHMELRVT